MNNQNKNTYVAIMAGGIGSRFWPISRTGYPKQFIDILGTGRTLIQQTVDRFRGFVPLENIYVITASEYNAITCVQLPMLPPENIILEPARKNTAPCIAYISFRLAKEDPNASLIVAPADHLILQDHAFLYVCQQALQVSDSMQALVTLGIQPTYANTGYGYIQREQEELVDGVYKVKNFTEKPSQPKAEAFLASGDFLWNSGIFIWRVNNVVAAFQQHMPYAFSLFQKGADKLGTPQESEMIAMVYALCPSVSIDVGIMEKADNVLVIPATFGWSDLGTWNSAWENMNKDDEFNSVAGDRVMVIESSRCVVRAPENKVVIVEGLQDYIVVDTNDVLLICKKTNEQEIKKYASEVKKLHGESFA